MRTAQYVGKIMLGITKILRRACRSARAIFILLCRLPRSALLYLKYRPYTMVPPDVYVKKLLIASACRAIPGCVVECGVWRGGMIAGLAEILGPTRHYYLFDSFDGMPQAKDIDGPAALAWQAAQCDKRSPSYLDNARADIDFVEAAMKNTRCPHYEINKGWFHETLPSFSPVENIAVLHIDGDWFDSIATCLEHLYRHMAPGGIIIVDDYYLFDGCSRAVHSFLSRNNLCLRIFREYGEVCVLHMPTRLAVNAEGSAKTVPTFHRPGHSPGTSAEELIMEKSEAM
jgi:O-methyltransferase